MTLFSNFWHKINRGRLKCRKNLSLKLSTKINADECVQPLLYKYHNIQSISYYIFFIKRLSKCIDLKCS